MEKKKKNLELVLRYGDFEAKHVFENLGDYEEIVDDLTAYCGIPIDCELVAALEQELLLRVIGMESYLQIPFEHQPQHTPLLRPLVTAFVESLRPYMRRSEISGTEEFEEKWIRRGRPESVLMQPKKDTPT